MKFIARVSLSLCAFFSHYALAAETYLSVFYDSAPLEGVKVSFNGEEIGETNRFGSVSTYLGDGSHTFSLSKDDTVLNEGTFALSDNEEVEISITFSDKKADPVQKVQKFDGSTSAIGFISGVVKDENNQPIANAIISIDGLSTEFSTAEDGAFRLELDRGAYDIDISHPDYSSATLSGIRVLAGVGVAANVVLLPEQKPVVSQQNNSGAPGIFVPPPMEELITIGTYNPTETASGIERFSTTVVDAIDVTQLARLGDSSAAAALTRIVGVSVTGGDKANVRGLAGRYIATTLNGIAMPSTDPFSRDVELDLFPASILEGIEVQKTFSASALGSSTGGSIKLNTKGLPDEREGKVKFKLGGNTEITGDDIITYRDSSTDWLTYDSGLRTLSQDVVDGTDGGLNLRICSDRRSQDCVDPRIASAYGVAFEDDYNVSEKTARPDVSLGASYGDISDNGLFGYYGAIEYGAKTQSRIDAFERIPSGFDGNYELSKESYSIDAYLVVGSQFRDQDEVLGRTILLRDSERTTELRSGFDRGDDFSSDEVNLRWVERHFFSQQFSGKHYFGSNIEQNIDWNLSYTLTNRYDPDNRRYQYVNGFLPLNSVERRWSELEEDSIDLTVDYVLPLQFSQNVSTEFNLGVLISDKERDVEQYRFSFAGGDNVDELDLSIDANIEDTLSYENFFLNRVELIGSTLDTDTYSAKEQTNAAYLEAETSIADAWTVVLGVRYEDFEQQLDFPNSSIVANDLAEESWLPALSVVYSLGDDWQFRFGASETRSYAGLTERAPAVYFDEENNRYIGNQFLETSSIENLDLRVEYYFSGEDSISLALFNKKIDKPIEEVLVFGSGSAADTTTFRNAKDASLYGIEIDGNYTLFETGSWSSFVSSNLAFIESEVTLDDLGLLVEGVDDQGRKLQGQSPFLFNLQLGFDHFPQEQKFTLLVNYFDDRINRSTSGLAFGPEVEKARFEVNANYEKTFANGLSLSGQIKNLTNADVELTINDIVIESYKVGVGYSFEINWQF